MKVHLDCIPCNLRQVLEAARLTAADQETQTLIARESLEVLAQFQNYVTSPELGRAAFQPLIRHTGVQDPYKKVKDEAIALAHRLYPAVEEFVENSPDRLRAALEASAIGNILDAAVYGDLATIDLVTILKEELASGLNLGCIEELREELKTAKSVVIVGDNAGETVFDRILISEIKRINQKKAVVYFAVRSAPIINDATMEDAIASGLDKVSTLIDSGSTAAALLLDEATPEFLRIYREADVVISKGQGNYETLTETKDRQIYFLLKAKCQVIANDIGVPLGSYVLLHWGA